MANTKPSLEDLRKKHGLSNNKQSIYNKSEEKNQTSLEEIRKKHGLSSNNKSDNGEQSNSVPSLEELRKKHIFKPQETSQVKVSNPEQKIEYPTKLEYSTVVKYLKDNGVTGASGIMTENEWRRRKGKDGGTYEGYLRNKIYESQTGKNINSLFYIPLSTPATQLKKQNVGPVYNPSAEATKFETETKNAYLDVKGNTAENKTTIKSNLPEKERKARIKELEKELNTLTQQKNGFSTATARGASGKHYNELIEKNNKRTAEITEELKQLKRVGEFTPTEMLQWEIDDAKAEAEALKQKLPKGQRMSSVHASHYAENAKAYYEATDKVKSLEKEMESLKKVNNAKNKITIESDMTDSERETRIKEINTELNNLTTKLRGYETAKAYGSFNKYLEDAEKKDKDRVDELQEELKTLNRVGVFSHSDILDWEIEDAKRELSRLKSEVGAYGTRPSVSDAEDWREKINQRYDAEAKLKGIERKKELYNNVSNFGDVINEDDFVGQTKANYRNAELSRKADKAFNIYMDNPTEENRAIAYAYDALSKQYMENNKYALDDEGAVASWISKSAAGYLPQFFDQIVPEAVGGLVGGILGLGLGMPGVGADIGAGIGSGLQMYGVMRGSVYRTLLAEGVDETTALSAANDEALISALIEGGETAISWALAGGGKALKAIGAAAKASVAKGSTNVATKFVAKFASKTTDKAALKAVKEVSKPLWRKGLRVGGGIIGNGLSEYGGEFFQQGVSIANKERAMQGETGKWNLSLKTGEVIADAVSGKRPEALAEMHEAGTEGFKIGVMFSGAQTIVNNTISHYSNAKTVKEQNEIAEKVAKDDKILDAIVEVAKSTGKDTVANEIAQEIETIRENGEVTGEQVKKLIAATDVYLQEDAKNQKETSERDSLEQAAKASEKEVVERRNKESGKMSAETLDALTADNQPITAEEVKEVTRLGENGSKLIAEIANEDGMSFSHAEAKVKGAYLEGLTNSENNGENISDPQQKMAFNAGRQDRIMQNAQRQAEAKNATVYDGTFHENEYTKKFSKAEKKMISTFAKILRMDAGVVDKIIANKTYDEFGNEIEHEANARHDDGKLTISNNRDALAVVYRMVLHESGHRMSQFATKEWGVLMNALYQRAEQSGRKAKLGVRNISMFDMVKNQHDEAGISMETLSYIEEVAVRELETIFSSAKEFNKWYAEISANPELKGNWQKFCDWISQVIEDIKKAWSQRKMTAEEKAIARENLAELERIRGLLAETLKASETAAQERVNEIQNKSSNTLENQAKNEYNEVVSHSLKKKTPYNEYNTIGMQWAYSFSTEIGDRKVLYKPSIKKFVLVEATKEDVGFIELKFGTQEQMREEKEYYEREEQTQNRTDGDKETVDKVLRDFEPGQNHNIGDNVDVGNRGTGIQNAEISEGKPQSNGAADTQTTDGNLKGVAENSTTTEVEDKSNYSLKKIANEGYSTEGTKWAIANGLLKENEQAKFWEDIANISKRGYRSIPKSKNGQYIIDVGQKLIFTNGDFKAATISSIIEFHGEYEANMNEYKEWIIDEERSTAQHGESIQIIEIVQGEGYVSEHLSPAYRTDARQNGSRKGTNSTEVNRRSQKDVKSDFSLKTLDNRAPSEIMTEFLDVVEDLENGKKNAVSKLSKYVDNGMITTKYYDELIEQYGAIPSGERPHRDVQVPRNSADGKKVSQTVRTILEAKTTPDEAVPTIKKMVEDGIFSYDAYTDKQAIEEAEAYLKENGWVDSLKDWFNSVEKGVVSKQHTAMGWALYNNSANLAKTTTSETEKKTAMETSLNILDAMVKHQRNAAQALQATRILKKLSPETQLYGVQKSVQAFQKELIDKYGKRAPNLKINEELAEKFLTAETQEERLDAEIEIYKDIGRQVPSNWLDKWNAVRYIGMLANLRTHGRNILGNAFFAPVVITKNLTATAIEAAVYRISGKKTVRGKALVWGSKADRGLLNAAWNDYANVADLVSNGGKYNEFSMGNKYIEEGRKIFGFKATEWVRKTNSEVLEKEDVWFSKPHYAYALAQYCKANNITAEQIERGRSIEPARAYAIKEAQKATYKDTNAFSQWVSELGRNGKKNKNLLEKGVGVVVEGVLPFRKTPANILARGVEYSPLGLLKGLSYDLVQVSKGKMSATEAIDNISAGLTGTGLLAFGVLLAAQGLIRGHGEDDKKEKEFKELMGHQAYSLELPNGTSVTLDWLAPEALPFFVGVNIWEATRAKGEKVNFSTILKAVSNITEPLLEMSCLQGLNGLIEGIKYASENDTSALMAVLIGATTSYLTQVVPTFLGQVERTGEENRMTTYTEKDAFLTKDMQYTLGKISSKIPFWDYNQIPYIDAWGRKEASGTALKRGFNNFLNPAYTSTIDTSNMEKELLRLYEKTGEDAVFPSRANKYFTVNGVRKDLTADEYVKYATLKGQKSYKLISDLIKSKAYKTLGDGEKVKAIDEAYAYADQKAKQAISNYKPDTWVKKADEFGSNVGNYISFRAEVSNAKKENGDKISKEEVVDIILDMAQNDSETWKMYLSMYDSDRDKYAYEKGIQGHYYMNFITTLNKYDKPTKAGKYGTYTQEEAYYAIKSLNGLSRQEKAVLWQSVNSSWKTSNNPFR